MGPFRLQAANTQPGGAVRVVRGLWFVVRGLGPQGILGVRGQPGGDPGAWSDSSNTFFGSLLIDSSLGFARAGHRMRAGRHSARPPLPKS